MTLIVTGKHIDCRYLHHVLHFEQKREKVYEHFMNLDFPRILLTERTVGSLRFEMVGWEGNNKYCPLKLTGEQGNEA